MKSTANTLLSSATKCLLAATLVASTAAPIGIRAASGRPDRDDHDQRGADHDPDERKPIRHVVVIFQENVSFDHYFATYPHAANTDGSPFAAKASTPLVNGLFPGGLLDHNPNSTQPFRLSSAQAATCDQDHNYKDEQKAFSAGAMNTFPETVGVGGPPSTCLDYGKGKGLVMGYYDGNTVTAFWNYAQHFAMSDNSYSTTFGPSTPGALNLIAGQTHGAKVAPDLLGRFGSASGNMTAIDGTGVGSAIGDPRPSPAFDNCTLPSPAPPSAPRTYITMTGPNFSTVATSRGDGFREGSRLQPRRTHPCPTRPEGPDRSFAAAPIRACLGPEHRMTTSPITSRSSTTTKQRTHSICRPQALR
jgi:hypothetical protein